MCREVLRQPEKAAKSFRALGSCESRDFTQLFFGKVHSLGIDLMTNILNPR